MRWVKDILDYEHIGDNWDGYGGVPPSGTVCQNAVQFIESLPEPVRQFIEDGYPNPHGTITLEFEQGEKKLSLEIGTINYGFFMTSDEPTVMEDGQLPVNPNRITELLNPAAHG